MVKERTSRRQWEDPTARIAINRVNPGKPQEIIPSITNPTVNGLPPKFRMPSGQIVAKGPDNIYRPEEITRVEQPPKSGPIIEAPLNLTIERRRKEIELIMEQLNAMRLLGLAGTGDYGRLGNKLRSIQLLQAEEVKKG